MLLLGERGRSERPWLGFGGVLRGLVVAAAALWGYRVEGHHLELRFEPLLLLTVAVVVVVETITTIVVAGE